MKMIPSLDRDDIAASCALLRAKGVGIKTYHKILLAYPSALKFYGATYQDVKARLPGIKLNQWQEWQDSFENESYLPDLKWLDESENRFIIDINHKAYPALLKQIEDAPAVLYVQGDINILSVGQLGVVGSRSPTPQAASQTKEIVTGLSKSGLTITSGLALGIDAAAHRAALDAGGRTIAVVGTGLDRVYPAKHHQLAHDIVKSGALVSEFPIGTGVRPSHFPRRNRIISGLSLGVFVTEASIKSGSLITAKYALEAGRELFAMPGSINNPLARGCHQLIKTGAKLVEKPDDILEELLPMAQASLFLQNTDEHETEEKNEDIDAEASAILNAMGYDACHIDDLIGVLALTVSEISAMLTMLEIEGYVDKLPGQFFQRTKKGA